MAAEQAEAEGKSEPKAKAKVAAASPPAPAARKYSVERLMTDCVQFTGHPASELAGALYGDDREELTRDEAIDAINEYHAREVRS